MSSTFLTVRAEALFASALQMSQQPAAEQVREAVTGSLSRFGVQGCATQVAGEFGEHPETAVRRMGWALTAVQEAYVVRIPAPAAPVKCFAHAA
ncbi:MAG TPA: hypothetical protein VES42_04320 [Pilimelia sp.]|nr:hypothetical protein [Pilimelia sp.]